LTDTSISNEGSGIYQRKGIVLRIKTWNRYQRQN
jgi:hypothetical protein